MKYLNFLKLDECPSFQGLSGTTNGSHWKQLSVNGDRILGHALSLPVPASAVATTRPTIQIFDVRIFTLHAKNSCTAPDTMP